ncbi:MAG: type II toxin-antitoxin system RelB/DinJ family antitoxin [Coriobacteriales bacterium]|nr:type II toxin-antitoxin system RelB/DinJ family antitoxin [Coriobacteriales bacterium]
MATTVQLNTRISPQLKQQGDVVFANAGLTSSEVVRAVWTYAATHNAIPDCLVEKSQEEEAGRRLQAIRDGAGIAHRLAVSLGYEAIDSRPSYQYMRDDMYDERITHMELNHAEA